MKFDPTSYLNWSETLSWRARVENVNAAHHALTGGKSIPVDEEYIANLEKRLLKKKLA